MGCQNSAGIVNQSEINPDVSPMSVQANNLIAPSAVNSEKIVVRRQKPVIDLSVDPTNAPELLEHLKAELQNNGVYDRLIKVDFVLDILAEVQNCYLNYQQTVEIIDLILDYLALSKNQANSDKKLTTNLLKSNFIINLTKRWEKLKNEIFFANKDALKVLTYICPLKQGVPNLYSHCFLDLKFDFDMDEIRKVAATVKGMFKHDFRSFLFLTNYLYKSCLKLEKDKVDIKEIQDRLVQVLNVLGQQNPPAPPLDGDQIQFNIHKTFETKKEEIPQIFLDVRKFDQNKRILELDQLISERSKQSSNKYKQFVTLTKECCEKQGFHFKSGIKVKDMSHKKAVERVKEKLLDKNFKKYSLEEELKTSNNVTLQSFTGNEYVLYQKEIKSMYDRLEEPIHFKVSDMLRGKCLFVDIDKANSSCTELLNKIKQNGYKVLQIDNRLRGKTSTSDLVLKILIGSVIAELQLVINLNVQAYQFSHKIYELVRSKFFTPLTMLKQFNQQMTNDYLHELQTIIKMNTRDQNKTDYKENINFTSCQQSFKQLISILPYKFISNPDDNVISINLLSQQLSRFKLIKETATKQTESGKLKLKSLGDYKYSLKQYTASLQYFNQFLKEFDEKQKDLLDKNYSSSTEIEQNLIRQYTKCYDSIALTYRELGNYPKAIEYLQKSIELNKKYAKSIYNDALSTSYLGNIYFKLGDYSKTETYLKSCLQKIETMPTKNKYLECSTWNDLGLLYKQKKVYKEAIVYYLKALDYYENVLKDQVRVSVMYNNLGSIYSNQGNYGEAIKYIQRAMDAKQKIDGKESYNYAISLKIYGQILEAQGKSQEALKVYQRVYQIYQKTNGSDSIQLQPILNCLGSIYQQLRNYQDAIKYYNIALALVEKVKGKESIDCALIHNNLGNVYDKLKKYDIALDCFNKCLVIEEKIKGKDNISSASTYCNIGTTYKNQAKYKEANEYNFKCLAIQEKVLGKDSVDVAVTINNIGLVYKLNKEYEKGLEFYTRSLQIRQKVLGKFSIDCAISCNNIGMVHIATKNFDEALKYLERSRAIVEKVKGKDSINHAEKHEALGLAHKTKGDFNQAILCYKEGLKIRKTINAQANLVLENIAKCYKQLGDTASYEDYLKQSKETKQTK